MHKAMTQACLLCSVVVTLVSPTAWADKVSNDLNNATLAEIRQELETVPERIRASMSKDQMSRFVSNMLMDRRIADAATAAGIMELPKVKSVIARATRDIVVRAYIDREMAKVAGSLPDLTALARERYMVNQAGYVTPEAIRVAHILFSVNEEDPEKRDDVVKARAMQTLESLRQGGDFSALAREQSEDPGSKFAGGELPGWSEKGKLVPPFEAAAYALKPGELSELVRSRYGYHIIKLLEKREARQQSFEEVKEPILKALRDEQLARKRTEWLKAFEGNKPIVLDDATLEALRKP